MPLLFAVLLATSYDPSVLTVPLEATSTPQELWIEKLHECENRNNTPRILDTNGYYSYGYLMFQMGTWLSYGKKFGATRENISSSTLQIKVAKSMLDAGGWRHWYTCAKKVRTVLGDYPTPVHNPTIPDS